MTAIINFAGSRTAPDGEVRGIDVAVRALLNAYAAYGPAGRLDCVLDDAQDLAQFQAIAAAAGRDPADSAAISFEDLARQDGCLFRQDPDIARLAAARQVLGARSFSLCGLVHTMSGLQTMEVVSRCLTAPTQAWDAIICPSHAIRDAIRRLWAFKAGDDDACRIHLPVIPLGVDTDRFTAITTPAHRAAQRAALGVADDAVVLLCHGRQSFVFKQHPLPALRAASHAAENAGRPIVLVFSGYFHPASFEADFRELAAAFQGAAQVDFVANDDPRFPDGLWAGADVFVSLSDNIQESFGLTPVEAMAAGLPAVISDWDGYRDTVRHGQDGMAIPTVMPGPGHGAELAAGLAAGADVYGEYLAGASQSTAVDVRATCEAVAALAHDPDLRRRLGQSGRARARDTFDWRVIIPQYAALWDELAARRGADSERTPMSQVTADTPDPFYMFQSFASVPLADADIMETVADPAEIGELLRHRMNLFRADLLLDPADLVRVSHRLRRAMEVQSLRAAYPDFGSAEFVRSLGWLLKMGICRLVPSAEQDKKAE